MAHYPKEGLKCAIHSCGVFLGISQSDELEETANYLIRLSDMTSGTHMTAVLPNYIRQTQLIHRHIDVKRHMTREWMGYIFQIINVITYIIMLMTVAVARGKYFGGQTCGDVAIKYPTYVAPHTSFFSMWRFYILLTGVLVITLSLPSKSRARQGIISRVDVSISLHNMLMGSFLLLWQNELLFQASLVLSVALGSVCFAYKRLEIGLRSTGRVTFKERFFVWTPLSCMLAWLSFNLVITIASTLKKYEWNGFGWQFEWAIVMIVGLTGLTASIIFYRTDVAFGLTMSMCMLSISAAQWNQYRSLGVLTEDTTLGGSFWLMIFTFVFSAVVACMAITSLSALVIRMFYKPMWRQRMAVTLTVSIQFGNATMYFAMVFINILASPWGYRMMGMKGTPPLIIERVVWLPVT